MPESGQGGSSWLAWAGWRTRVPPDWRPLRISGSWTQGRVVIASAEEPVLQVSWLRPGRRQFDVSRWMRRRFRSLKMANQRAEGPFPDGFTVAASAPERGGDRRFLRYWCGWASGAGLVVEVAVNPEAAKKARQIASGRVVPLLRVSERDGPTRWAVFGASFESPSGYRLLDKRLTLGDLVLRLRAGDGSCLLLRQVYPAETALARRPIERWMRTWPFEAHRRYREADGRESWMAQSFGRRLEGVRQAGRKRLPFPLGFCAPRETLTVAAVDPQLDRLLIAEHDALRRPDETMLSGAIGRMNWALLDLQETA